MLRIVSSSRTVLQKWNPNQHKNILKDLQLRPFSSNIRLRNEVDDDDLSHKYSNTVRLPVTSFPNRSNSELIESKLKPQATSQLYKWNIERPTKGDLNRLFILHDGPPYANGDLHVGHALNKVLKDIINRFELINGKIVYYKPGWDCHGLPIELKTLEKLSKVQKEQEKLIKKKLKKLKDRESSQYIELNEQLQSLKISKLSPLDIITLSKTHALEAQANQSHSFQQLGIMGDFNDPYLTLKKSYVVNQLKIFKKLFDNKLVKRQRKPVYWGCENATALAEGELEYNDHHKSTAAFIKFPIVSKLKSLEVDALIWTTTPWTLLANRAVSINKNFEYTLLNDSSSSRKLLVASDLADSIITLNDRLTKTNTLIQGSELVGLTYTNPLYNDASLEFPIISGDHVTITAGTGLVHTAPGHGHDDYLVGLSNKIPVYSPVDDHGKYTSDLHPNCAEFVGMKVLTKGNESVLDKTEKLNMLFYKDENYVHSYPYDWRSKKPIIIRSTPQWFIDVSRIKDDTTNSLNNVTFVPEKGVNRLTSFIKTRNEWCISRQRSWGVPIPVIYDSVKDEAIMEDDVIDKIIEQVNIHDIEGWFTNNDIKDWIPERLHSQAEHLVKGKDTMDVWFDSGSSWKVIEEYLIKEGLLGQANERGFLSDVYLEGSDQHRGWFQSSILTKMGVRTPDEPTVLPYKKIVTHGFTLDEKGDKMSKSLGNTILPSDILDGNKKIKIAGLGIDGLRLWVAQADYSSDVSIGPTILKHVGDNLKKIRFTYKFMLGNLNDFKMENSVEYEELHYFDKFILSKLHKLEKRSLVNYKNNNYSTIIRELNYFLNVELSSMYFDIRKDSLYTDLANSFTRRSTQTVFVEILKSLISITSPIMPIITQEVWNHLPSEITQQFESPFMKGWYHTPETYMNESLEEEFKQLLNIRSKVKSVFDVTVRVDKVIKNSLETKVIVNTTKSSELLPILEKYSNFLSDYLVISKFELNPTVKADAADVLSSGEFDDGSQILILKSEQCKCPRCWKFTREQTNELCERCDEVVKLQAV